MELPTYTSIWKIEKRLYKLYDFRLPVPVPVGQVAGFLAIAVPYAVILALAGAPFSHTWLWAYVLPPSALAWLVSRPVLEGKRLPELAASQLRYLCEPATWCRMAPLAEKDDITVVARVWRSSSSALPAANSPAGESPRSHHDQVVVVPCGHGLVKAGQLQRDRACARQPLPGTARIVVLGCVAGAGQTLTTLMAGTLLASVRGEPVAVLDLNRGPGSLYDQARAMPRMLASLRNPGGQAGGEEAHAGNPAAGGSVGPLPVQERGLQVITAEDPAQGAAALIDAVVARYPLTIADPSGRHVAASLKVADQLILVAPASKEAAVALARTLEWLESHDHDRLARAAVTVLTGVSEPTARHADKAAAVVSGRCRAMVRVPWDARLAALARPPETADAAVGQQPLSAAAIRAYTALTGVLVSALADAAMADRSPQ